MIQFEKAFTFFRDDEKWIEKLAIGAGLMLASIILAPLLIGLIGFMILGGYSIRLLQNVRDGHPNPLPEWGDWGADLTRGFKLTLVYLVWALPVVILTIPIGIGTMLADGDPGPIAAVLLICGNCLSGLYGLFLAIASPGFTIAFARDEEVKSGLEYRAVYEWTVRNIGQVIIVVLVMMVASAALGLLGLLAGLILCGVGLIATLPLAQLLGLYIRVHLFGQLANLKPFDGAAGSSYSPPGTDDYAAAASPPPVAYPGETPIDPIVDNIMEEMETDASAALDATEAAIDRAEEGVEDLVGDVAEATEDVVDVGLDDVTDESTGDA